MCSTKPQTRRMVLIGGWTNLYRKARAYEFGLTVFQEKSRLKPEHLELIDQLFTLPLDHPNITTITTLLHQRQPFDCVVSLNEAGLLTAATISEQLHIMGNPLRPVLLTRDKRAMREHLSTTGLRTIPYTTVSSIAETLAFAEAHGFPIILKPNTGTGSMHIHKLDLPQEIERAVHSIQRASPNTPILVEKFLEGTEVSVESFSWQGKHHIIAVTDKRTTGAPYFVEVEHVMPSSVPTGTLQKIHSYTREFLSSIGHQMGPAHTEIMVTQGEPYIIESHTRAGGDYIYELTELAYGVDVFSLLFQGLSGEDPLVVSKGPRGAAIRFLTLPEGYIKRSTGFEEARSQTGIERCHISLHPGQKVIPFTNSEERYGWIMAQGATRQEALSRIERAFHTINIEME